MLYALLNIWPTTVEGWILLGAAVLGFIGALAKLIPTMIKLGKALVELAKQKNFDKLKKIATKAMAEAQATGLSGQDKLNMVIAAVKAGAKEANIETNEEDIKALIKSIGELKEFYKAMAAANEVAKNNLGLKNKDNNEEQNKENPEELLLFDCINFDEKEKILSQIKKGNKNNPFKLQAEKYYNNFFIPNKKYNDLLILSQKLIFSFYEKKGIKETEKPTGSKVRNSDEMRTADAARMEKPDAEGRK